MRRVVLLIGLTEHFCGYMGLWLVASGRAVLPYWAMVGLTVMAFNGSNWIDTACIATNVHNFPGDRGSVVGQLRIQSPMGVTGKGFLQSIEHTGQVVVASSGACLPTVIAMRPLRRCSK